MRRPSDLKFVAYLFVLQGVFAIARMMIVLLNDRVCIDIGVLGLFVGFGLLGFSNDWWRFAKAFTLFKLLIMPLVLFVWTGLIPSVADFRVTTFSNFIVSEELVILTCVFVWAASLWQYHVLNAGHVRAIYERTGLKQ